MNLINKNDIFILELKDYEIDINNLFFIKDYLILESSNNIQDVINQFNFEEKLIKKIEGKFTIKLNNKYLIIIKDKLKEYLSYFYKYILQIKKEITNINLNNNDIKNILSLNNLFLILGHDNNTLYSLKRKILINKKDNINNEIILSEYLITCLININYRESAISWDYHYFLISNFKLYLNDNIIILKDYIDYNINLNIFLNYFNFSQNDNLILIDLNLINLVNIKENRNYHMWTYLTKIINFHIFDKNDIIYIICYALLILTNNPSDYSAYSFLRNFIKFYLDDNKLNLITKLKQCNYNNLNKINISYLQSLIDYLNSK